MNYWRLYISEVKTMAAILMIAYIAAAYWATNKIWWSKKVYVYSNATYFYMTRFIICMVAGFVTIPLHCYWHWSVKTEIRGEVIWKHWKLKHRLHRKKKMLWQSRIWSIPWVLQEEFIYRGWGKDLQHNSCWSWKADYRYKAGKEEYDSCDLLWRYYGNTYELQSTRILYIFHLSGSDFLFF